MTTTISDLNWEPQHFWGRWETQLGTENWELKFNYMETVRPMHEMFVEPSKQYADIIVQASQPNEKAIEMIVDMIKQRTDRLKRRPGEKSDKS